MPVLAWGAFTISADILLIGAGLAINEIRDRHSLRCIMTDLFILLGVPGYIRSNTAPTAAHGFCF